MISLNLFDDGLVIELKVFSILHKKRMFGFTKYGMFRKIFFALPEFLYFFYRLKKGYFKN